MAETIIKYNRPKDNSTVIYNGTGSGNYYDIDGEGTTPSFDPSEIDQRLLWKLSSGDMALVPKSSYNNASGESSVAIGTFTQTNNEGEFAIGKFNQSLMNETMFTIGDGTDENNRHNLIQVGNANTVINNHLSGTTSNFNSLTSTTVSGNTAIFNNGTFYSGITSPSAAISAITSNTINVNNKLTTDELEAVSGYIQTLLSEEIIVDNLTVTKAAHFFKLIIDEIKATQGQVIITPANAVIDKVSHYNGYYRCYFRATDGEKKITNSFAANDQVVCQTFNAATGTSYNVSNTYYWRLCTGTGRILTRINDEYVDCYYVNLSETDLDSNSISIPQKGDNIVQLGNRTDATRQAAIIISAYNNQFLDPTIKAPSIVQYDGINNYDLSTHRLNVISKNFNEFKGAFKTSTGDDIEQLIDDVSSGATAYLHTAWANSSDGSLDFTKDASGGSFSYIGTCTNHTSDDTSLIYSDYTWNKVKGADGASGSSISISSTSITYAVTTADTQPQDSEFIYTLFPEVEQGDFVWSRTIVTYSDGTQTKTYSVAYSAIDGVSGETAEYYTLNPVVEKAIVDKNATLGVEFRYNIIHVSGDSRTLEFSSASGYHLRMRPDTSQTYTDFSYGNEPYYVNASYMSNYHKQQNKPTFFFIDLVYGSGATLKTLDRKIVAIQFNAAATLEITDEITATVQGQADEIDEISGTVTSHTNSISTLNQNFSSITSTVSAHTIAINGLDDDVYELSHEVSDISQTADQIQSTVTHLRANATNLFNFTECNFSHGDYQSVLPAVQSYGIECKHPLSRVYNLGFNGEGGDFTVSFECKMFGLSSAQVACNLCDKAPVEATYFTAVDGEWRKFTFTFKNVTQYIGDSSDSKPYNGFIDFENSNFAYSKFMVVRHLMITRGTCANEFQVSPKDMGNGTNEKFLEWSYGASIEKTNEKYNGMDVYRPITIPSSGVYDYIYCNNVEVKQYKIYTLSFWAKGDANGVYLESYMWANGGQISHNANWVYRTYQNIPYGATLEGNYGDGFTVSRLTNEWKQYIVYFNNWNANNRNIIACRYGYDRNGGNINSFKICGVQIREGYWTKEQMNSESQITQRADYIEAKVNDVSVKIDSGQITLNGDTQVNGTLTLIDDDQGFLLAGDGGKTQITPTSLGTYSNFTTASTNNYTVSKQYQTQVQTWAPTESSTTASWFATNNFGVVQSGSYIPLSGQTSFFRNVNSGNALIPISITNTYKIYINDSLVSTITNSTQSVTNIGSYTTSAKGTLRIERLTNATFRTANLINNSVIGHISYVVQLPREMFTLIGYDGIGSNFGTNSNVYFGSEGTFFRYGNYGINISNNGIKKLVGNSWLPLNYLNVVRTSNSTYNLGDSDKQQIEMLVTTSSSSQTIILPKPSTCVGRRIYIKCNGSGSPKVYCDSTSNTTRYFVSPTSNYNDVLSFTDFGSPLRVFISDGTYWQVGYQG